MLVIPISSYCGRFSDFAFDLSFEGGRVLTAAMSAVDIALHVIIFNILSSYSLGFHFLDI